MAKWKSVVGTLVVAYVLVCLTVVTVITVKQDVMYGFSVDTTEVDQERMSLVDESMRYGGEVSAETLTLMYELGKTHMSADDAESLRAKVEAVNQAAAASKALDPEGYFPETWRHEPLMREILFAANVFQTPEGGSLDETQLQMLELYVSCQNVTGFDFGDFYEAKDLQQVRETMKGIHVNMQQVLVKARSKTRKV